MAFWRRSDPSKPPGKLRRLSESGRGRAMIEGGNHRASQSREKTMAGSGKSARGRSHRSLNADNEKAGIPGGCRPEARKPTLRQLTAHDPGGANIVSHSPERSGG